MCPPRSCRQKRVGRRGLCSESGRLWFGERHLQRRALRQDNIGKNDNSRGWGGESKYYIKRSLFRNKKNVQRTKETILWKISWRCPLSYHFSLLHSNSRVRFAFFVEGNQQIFVVSFCDRYVLSIVIAGPASCQMDGYWGVGRQGLHT